MLYLSQYDDQLLFEAMLSIVYPYSDDQYDAAISLKELLYNFYIIKMLLIDDQWV